MHAKSSCLRISVPQCRPRHAKSAVLHVISLAHFAILSRRGRILKEEHRPHSGLDGRTPVEVHREVEPASQLLRIEPRAKWRRGVPCASPQASVAGEPGAFVRLEVGYQAMRRHLPVSLSETRGIVQQPKEETNFFSTGTRLLLRSIIISRRLPIDTAVTLALGNEPGQCCRNLVIQSRSKLGVKIPWTRTGILISH